MYSHVYSILVAFYSASRMYKYTYTCELSELALLIAMSGINLQFCKTVSLQNTGLQYVIRKQRNKIIGILASVRRRRYMSEKHA
jgi:hypothetical protein